MRLDKIKLAGFKSFVDPTAISFSTNLTGIVGPNGCGKSNTIDAVRWVMGERSAKHLRGDSMTDVIFSGAATRKPVGQASVELVFDNSDGSCGGEYASYSEISVKRIVSRDGTSSYYLNSTRCRRRDVMDLFLGTGMGPRSYAIIEQGMISRFIEAKPDDMRVFIEEAAGISKYKERRRETENRIKHTRENLDRINDLRQELEKQIAHLQRQANTAEKYKTYKDEERLMKAQLLALRCRSIDTQSQAQKNHIAEKETAYEAAVAQLRGVEKQLEYLREQHTEAHDSFNVVQGEFYKFGADVARIEQAITHGKEKRQQLEEDAASIEASLQDAQSTLDTDNQLINSLANSIEEVKPALESAREAEQISATALSHAEESMQDWQYDWEEFNRNAAEPSKTVQVEQTRLQHLEQHQQQLESRVDRNQSELNELGGQSLEEEIAVLQEQCATAVESIDAENEQLLQNREQISQQREVIEQHVHGLDGTRSSLQEQQGRLASLDALQEDALGKHESAITEWLSEQGLENAQYLAEFIQVERQWQSAAETVLGFHLQAIGVDNASHLTDALASIEKGAIGIIERHANNVTSSARDFAPSLLQYVSSDWPLDGLLSGIYVAESVAEAMALRTNLQAHESIITMDGVWVGPNWLRMSRNADEQAGVLQREQDIRDAQKVIAELGAQVEEQQSLLEVSRDTLHEQEQRRADIQSTLDTMNQSLSDLKSSLSSRETALQQVRARGQQIETQLAELKTQLEQDKATEQQARERLREAESKAAIIDTQRSELEGRRDNLRENLDQARDQARDDHNEAHQHALRFESINTELNSTRQAMQRIESQLSSLVERRDSLQAQMSEGEEPLNELVQQRESSLKEKQQSEEKLNDSRRQVQDIEHKLRESTDDSGNADNQVQAVRTELEQLRMDYQGIKVRLQTIQEQINETDFEFEALVEGLSEQDSAEQWEGNVAKLEARIQRLGAINLAAIDEFKERSEKKEYLDAQMSDLEEALQTLENAISKIDTETRTRFKETYDKVNAGLKDMFPRLFGGGHAYMELTGDDLLSTGITIMARPPGKRNGTIHLLSGGEKALTAVALVFAIFKLNPAPFCMLDEVDAPLDDANVGRFCALVKEMSEHIQFIFISHNKVTMELAGQLMGVTMSEPGVSRLVAVDVDEAAKIAAV